MLQPMGAQGSDVTERVKSSMASLPGAEALACRGQVSECTCQATLMVHKEEHRFSGAGSYKTIRRSLHWFSKD